MQQIQSISFSLIVCLVIAYEILNKKVNTWKLSKEKRIRRWLDGLLIEQSAHLPRRSPVINTASRHASF